jgi:hypothetical protein
VQKTGKNNIFIFHKDFLALLFIALMALVYVSPGFLFPGKSFGPLSNLYTWAPWNLTRMDTQSMKGNELLNDQILQFIPWREYAAANLRKGVVPLWNPYQYCGAPFLGNSQSAPFYPINLLTLYLNIKWYLIVSAFLKLLIAGSGMYGFLRLSGLSPVSSLWSGITFMFFGFNIIWLGHPHTQSFVWVPWILACLNYLNQSPGRLSLGLTGICTGIAFLGGHPETIFITGLIYILYMLYHTANSPNIASKGKYLAGATGALLIGIAIASIQLLPALDYLLQSNALKERLDWKPLTDFQGKRALITWLLPDFFGNPLFTSSWVKNELFFQFNFAEASDGYIGILPLLMISGFFLYRRWHRETLFWGMVAIMGFVIAYRVPFIGPFCAKLPGISLIHPKRLVILTSISLIILSAQGLNAFLTTELTSRNRRFIYLMAVMLGLTGALSLFPLFSGISFPALLLSHLGTSITKLPITSVSQIIQQSLNIFGIHILLGIIALLTLLVLKKNSWGRNILLISCITAEMICFSWGYNTGITVNEYPPSNPLKTFLSKDNSLFRFISLNEWTLYPPNSAMIDNLYDVRGYDAIVPRYYERYFRILNLGFWKDSEPRLWSDYPGKDQKTLVLLGMMNVKYLLSNKPLSIDNAPLVFQEKSLWVYQNPLVLPRAYVVPTATIENNEDKIKSILTSLSFNPANSVILAGTPDVSFHTDKLLPGSPVNTHYLLPNTIKIAINTPTEGFLFISENYLRGWKAFSDGKEIPIYKANGCFMSVKLDKACHEVILLYKPLSFILGKIISILGGLGCLLLIFYELCRLIGFQGNVR